MEFPTLLLLPFLTLVSLSLGGIISNLQLDPKCVGITLHEFRFSECNAFPCTMRRGKEYIVEADFTSEKNLTKPMIRCGTSYLGNKDFSFTFGVCPEINKNNGSCPLEANRVYNAISKFNLKYYVPPMQYSMTCRVFEESDGVPLICGSGSGNVV